MTYKDLARTFEILSKYGEGKQYIGDWAGYSEYGHGVEFAMAIEDIKELRDIG